MTAVSTATMPDLARRDLTLDLARVTAVVFVVIVHLLQVGIGFAPDGALVTSRPAEQQPWFDAATWVGQIMPLFFVVGGFASAAGWASWTAKGGDAAGFICTRTLRLAQPALPLFVFLAVVLVAAGLLGAPPELVDAAAVGVGMPLWFLAAYLVCQAAVPLMARLHASAPRRVLVVLLVAVIAVDVVRYSTGVEQVGLLNLLFVWPLVQQFGFWYHDGWFDRRSAWTLVGIAALSYLLLGALVAWGPYATSMLANLNPPTVTLVVLGVAQACLLRVAKPALTALMRTRIMRGVVFVLGSRLMTVYLWHLPVILIVSGLLLLIPVAAPEPAGPAWWWSRPPLLIAVLAVLWMLSLALVRFEAVGTLGATPSSMVVALGWACAFVPPFVVMEWDMHTAFAVGGAVLLTAAVLLLRTRSARRSDRADERVRARD